MTTIQLQTRNDWGAVPPKATTPLNWSKVDKFIVHYSGANRSQTVRSIQAYCMDVKGHSDIDYNELVRGNVLYVGRGNNVGSHTLGNNSTSYGVCMIGLDGDATSDDLNVIRSRYEYACQRAGRKLQMLGHMQAPGLTAGYTDCPGSQLQSWINAGMPYQEGIFMALTDVEQEDLYRRVCNLDHFIFKGNAKGLETIDDLKFGLGEGTPVGPQPYELTRKLNQILTRPPVDQAAIDAAVLAAITSPAVLAAIAAAVRPVVDSELDEAFTAGADQD